MTGSAGAPETDLAKLSQEGHEAADAIAYARSRQDAVGLIRAWISAVRAIEQDRDYYYDDYIGLLLRREVIENVIGSLEPIDAEIFRHAAAKADATFRKLTFDDGGKTILKLYKAKTEDWYWRRLPISGHIARSFDAYGY